MQTATVSVFFFSVKYIYCVNFQVFGTMLQMYNSGNVIYNLYIDERANLIESLLSIHNAKALLNAFYLFPLLFHSRHQSIKVLKPGPS